ncbi:hypothetical protein [Streptomyces sp. NPDC047028]|uniref:hypothetical protein n=1 Tax=Streptomyces sp. NPDC047028 TaxID=3155793 RepID=UPI0033D8E7EE
MRMSLSRWLVVMAATLLLTGLRPAPSVAVPQIARALPRPAAVGPWAVLDYSNSNALTGGQGLATVTRPDGTTYTWFDGIASVPLRLRLAGWSHVGDPDSRDGYVVEPYQKSSGDSKMFRVWTPGGQAVEFYHRDVPGEATDNNFAAIAPDGDWIVSGQWGDITSLPFYPMPYLNHAVSGPGQNLPLAGAIRLDHAISAVQGCAFTTVVQLVCSSDSDSSPLGNTKPLIQIDLARSLTGGDVTGRVTELGTLPLESVCSGSFEVEGIDYADRSGDLRVEVIPPGPCAPVGTVWRFRR